ncbi:MAG: hypothetical protein WAL91_07435 [Propionicimonas sp.]
MEVMSSRDWLGEGRTRAALRAELRAGRLVQPRLGMVAPADEADAALGHRRRLVATLPFLGPDTYFSHTSAATLHGLPLLAKRHGETVVVRTGGGHGNINPTLHARRAVLGEGEVAVVDGLPVTSLARTVGDLVRSLPFPEAVMVADAGLARGLQRGDLLARTASGRGCRLAARVLLFADPRAESPGESLSRVRLAQAGLPRPELQKRFFGADGGFLGRGDFWWEEFGLIGEFDGAAKYEALLRPGQTATQAILAEKRREQALQDAGFTLIRWTWADLWTPGLSDRIRRAMTRPSPRATHPHRAPASGAGPHAQRVALDGGGAG